MTHHHEPLDKAEIQAALSNLGTWKVKDAKLHAEFKFKNFTEAFAFMTKVALASEKLNHHPDWSNRYNTVTIDLITHQNNAISAHDVELAEAIDQFTDGAGV